MFVEVEVEPEDTLAQQLDVYPVATPRQLWFEARLNNVPEAERWMSLVPEL